MDSKSLEAISATWLANDWKKGSRDAIQRLMTKNDEQSKIHLKQLLYPRISFGTAGLRAEMLPGFAMINHVTVRQTALGLADYLSNQLGAEAINRGVVIGYDHRSMPTPFFHTKFFPQSLPEVSDFNSYSFAQLTAATLEVKGLKTLWLGKCHTPLVAFAVKDLGAAAGIMITASHNPKTYNGLKVYWHNGCQIIQPHDAGISASIQNNTQAPAFSAVVEKPIKHIDLHLSDELGAPPDMKYVTAIKRLVNWPQHRHPRKFVFTALHGVGTKPCMQALSATVGEGEYALQVGEQAEEDPDFPTVKFPNPEEDGAMDLAMRKAETTGCDTVMAVDPDADRFAAGERLKGVEWHRFTGNQIGILLAAFVLEQLETGPQQGCNRAKVAMLTSTVSTGMLKSMAGVEGFHYEETLTGFKWMGNRVQDLERQGFDVRFAFEEALGYMFPQVVYDKDGVTAMVMFLAARTKWGTEDLTPFDKLDLLYQKYGYFADANTYVVSPTAEITNEVFASIRKSQRDVGAGTAEKPAVLAGRVCKSYRDLTTGVDTNETDGRATLPVDPKTHMITCELEDSRFTVRGSGTEPKIKLYVESRASTMQQARDKAKGLQEDILDDWLPSLRA